MLPKPGRDPTSPSAYRPFCLLDVEGKLFKRFLRCVAGIGPWTAAVEHCLR